jgi:hypothetical protein
MNDIDTLFERIQSINHKDPSDLIPSDIDSLVDFYRYRRTRKATMTRDHDTSALDTLIPAPRPKVNVAPGAIRRFTRK